MDIIRWLSIKFWEWMGELPIEFTALFTRCVIICLLCVCFGQGLRELAQKGLRDTLPLQIAAFLAAVIAGVAVPLAKLYELTDNQRTSLLIFTFCGCLLLPYVAVHFLVRRKGYQAIACKIAYGIELLLLIIQIIVLIAR